MITFSLTRLDRFSDLDIVEDLLTMPLHQLGPIVEFTSLYDRYKPLTVVNRAAWKENAGEYNDAIYNLGSHLIDQALTLFGKPKKVTCRSWAIRGVQGLDDSVSPDCRRVYSLSSPYPPRGFSPSRFGIGAK